MFLLTIYYLADKGNYLIKKTSQHQIDIYPDHLPILAFSNRPIFGFTREPFLAEAQSQGSPGSGLPDIITQATLKCFYCLWNSLLGYYLLYYVKKNNVTTYYTTYIFLYIKYWKHIWKIWPSSIVNWPLLFCCYGSPTFWLTASENH